MISKEKFLKVMGHVQDNFVLAEECKKVSENLSDFVVDHCCGFLTDSIMELVADSMELPETKYGNTIYWWFFENEMGKNKHKLITKDGKEHYIKNLEELYDYLVKYEVGNK